MLKIIDLKVAIDDKILLDGFNLHIKKGEIHAIMGPNGAGKSTLSKVISGHSKYKVLEGDILYYGNSLLDLSPDERALKGIFVSFQYPIEISGISNFEFLYACYIARQKKRGQQPIDKKDFDILLKSKLDLLDIKREFVKRSINEGFSGGEKKKNEILQMALFSPQLAVLDEIDSGLDVDALKIITNKIKALKTEDNSYILITHYERLLNYISPDYVHILCDGKVIKTGGADLASEIERRGYDWLIEEKK